MMRLRRGKCRACGAVPSGASVTTAPAAAIAALQVGILGRVGHVEAAGHRRDRAPGAQRAAMRRGVDAARQAGDHDQRRARARRPGPPPCAGRWPRRCVRRRSPRRVPSSAPDRPAPPAPAARRPAAPAAADSPAGRRRSAGAPRWPGSSPVRARIGVRGDERRGRTSTGARQARAAHPARLRRSRSAPADVDRRPGRHLPSGQAAAGPAYRPASGSLGVMLSDQCVARCRPAAGGCSRDDGRTPARQSPTQA